MPEVAFDVRWPDGSVQQCMSPSRSIEAVLVPGASYPVAEFVRRSGDALRLGSERVRQKYGFHCTAAAAEIDAIERRAQSFLGDGAEEVVVVERMGRAVAGSRRSPVGGHHSVVIIGGGQAGLSASWYLQEQGVDHLVLERSRAFSDWRDGRWDAFCLVTPNWQCDLPGHPYDGDDPDGFMVREEILDYLGGFLASFDPPLVEGVEVTRVGRAGAATPFPISRADSPSDDGSSAGDVEAGRFVVETTAGTVTADQVIVAVGAYHVPFVPPAGAALPPWVTQVNAKAYRNPSVLPDGAVLVVGSGQSGVQIAEDLHIAGRQVHLAVGAAPRVARRHRGRDVVAWLQDMGHYDLTIEDHPEGNAARKEPNHYVTGRDGGHDLDLRAFATEGMQLHGRLASVDGSVITFSGDLAERLDAADATYNRINATIDKWIDARGIDAPPAEPYEPSWHPAAGPTSVDLAEAGIRSVIWATGFTQDWSWVELPWLDDTGYPEHERGVTSVPGLHLLGMPWLHTWGSGRFASINRDAAYLAARVVERAGAISTR